MQTFINNSLHPFFLQVSSILGKSVEIVWYYPVVFLCLVCGIFFTLRFGFVQFRGFKHAIDLIKGKFDNPDEPGHITHFQALMAALSGTIGLGNIAGVAIAISIGGPGTIFWMWLVGILGMATKFAECTLGTKYRVVNNETKTVFGGPMFYIKQKLPKYLQPLAILFAVSTVFGSFGAGGMFQSNQAASALNSYFNIPPYLTGIILAFFVGLVIIGGIKRIGNVASKIVPSMCIIYVAGALLICLLNITSIPSVIALIFNDAFTGTAVAGGSIGTVVIWGVRRAIFSNEAGLGSASIAHAAVKTSHPIREGVVASIGPFIDTIIVCTATAIIIVLSGHYKSDAYTPKGEVVNFENIQMDSPQENWIVKASDDNQGNRLSYITNNEKPTSFTTGRIKVVETKNTWYGTPVTQVIGDGIQFKTKRSRGKYALIIRDKNNNKLISLKLHGDDKFFFTSTVGVKEMLTIGFSLNRTSSNGEWQTHTIKFEHDTKKYLVLKKYLHELSLQFVVDKGSKQFEVDDIFVGKPKSGIELTIASFDTFLKGFGSIFIVIAVVLFAFSTMITWSYYGEVALRFLLPNKSVIFFKWIFVAVILLGSVITLSSVLNFTDLMIGLMVIPNSIAIVYLAHEVFEDKLEYFKKLKNNEFQIFKK